MSAPTSQTKPASYYYRTPAHPEWRECNRDGYLFVLEILAMLSSTQSEGWAAAAVGEEGAN